MNDFPPASCATCQTGLGQRSRRVRCSVATCNTGRFKLRFCSVACWRAHLATARHRKADYVEEEPPGDLLSE